MDHVINLKMGNIGASLHCHLCKGFPVDCVSLTCCCHIFCRSCIVIYIKQQADMDRFRVQCPVCSVLLDDSRPFNALRPDQTLRTLLTKLNPELYFDEKKRRNDFLARHPATSVIVSNRPNSFFHATIKQEPEDQGVWLPQHVPDQVTVVLQYDADLTFSLTDSMSPSLLRRQAKAVTNGASFHVPCTSTVMDLTNMLTVTYRLRPPNRVIVLDVNLILAKNTTLADIIRFRAKPLIGEKLHLTYVFLTIPDHQYHDRCALITLITSLNNRRPPPIAPLFTGVQKAYTRKRKSAPESTQPRILSEDSSFLMPPPMTVGGTARTNTNGTGSSSEGKRQKRDSERLFLPDIAQPAKSDSANNLAASVDPSRHTVWRVTSTVAKSVLTKI